MAFEGVVRETREDIAADRRLFRRFDMGLAEDRREAIGAAVPQDGDRVADVDGALQRAVRGGAVEPGGGVADDGIPGREEGRQKSFSRRVRSGDRRRAGSGG